MPKAVSRGIRNNNPGNIRWSRDNWLGLVLKKDRTDKDFCQFTDPKWGIRALGIVLLNYSKKKGMVGVGNPGIDTVKEIISRWAPPNENNTQAYINGVCRICNVKESESIDMWNKPLLANLIVAIITHENGSQPYAMSLILQGVSEATFAIKKG